MNHPGHGQDLYYEQQAASRSPGSHRHQPQTLHRQPSRHFDAYGQMPNPIFQNDDSGQRYDSARFDRMAGLQGNGYAYDMGQSQSWNPNAFGNSHTFNTFAATGRMKPQLRGRTGLPTTWLDQQPQMPIMSGFNIGAMGPPVMSGHQSRNDSFADPDEELIPTAIVIKNIPFAVKKEQLVDLMTQMNLPLPYAFNYHFDNGVFRGLAFANFTSAEETSTVIDNLNHFELQGRKLRVEYKKMLPLQERERIEREKRERRGQLEEQHRPMPGPALQNHPSLSSLASHIPATSPSPVSSRAKPDLNDPQTLAFYSELLLFKDDMSREALIFPSSLTPTQRRNVHTLAHHMGLQHLSRGTGEQRQVHVLRNGGQVNNISPPMAQMALLHGESSRRVLNRAATTDFNEARGEAAMYGLRGQQSTGFLGIPDSPGGFGTQNNLRAAKSFADLRSYTPSPVPSSASFPTSTQVQTNIARFQDIGAGSQSSSTPTLTPTASGNALGDLRNENMLVNGLGGMNIGSTLGPNGGSPRRLRGMFSWEDAPAAATAPIGSNRNFAMGNFDDRNQTLPMRQPRGPTMERGPGFSRPRQNGHQARGSDELRQSQNGVEIIVE